MSTTAATLPPAAKGSMRPFITIWIGQLVSLLGSGLTSFALAVWIYDQTGQATPFALTVLFGNLPRLLLAPLAGSLADRWNRKALMLLADTGSALVTLSVVVLLSMGELHIWMVYLIATAYACLGAFQEPAYSASITMLVPKEQLARASGLGQLSEALGGLVTPVLGGFLFVAVGLRGIVLIDFITYFAALFTLLITAVPQPLPSGGDGSGEGEARSSWWQDALFGWRYLLERQGLFGLLMYYAAVNFFLNFSGVLLGPMLLSRHSASEYGLVQMAIGAGMLLGSLVLSAWGGPKGHKVPFVILFISVSAVGLALAGVSPSVWVTGLGMGLMMFVIPLASGLSQALFQLKVAPSVQGRVFAARGMLSRAVMPLAFLLAGPLADRLLEPAMRPNGPLGMGLLGNLLGSGAGRGIGLGFVLSGLCLLLLSVLVFANPRVRLLEEELPDHESHEFTNKETRIQE